MDNVNTSGQGNNKPSFLKSMLKLFLVLIILFFFFQKFKSNWIEVSSYDWQIDIPLFLLSLAAHLIVFIIFSKVWCILIKAFGFNIHLKHAFKIGYITNLGRYIPGKIWPVIGMAYLAKQLDIPEGTSVTSWIVALIFTLPAAFLVGILAILFSPQFYTDSIGPLIDVGLYLFAGTTFVVSFLIIIIPNKSFAIINYILRYFKKPLIEFHIDFKTALLVYFGYVACWICYGFAFWLFISSLIVDKTIPVIPTIGAFVLAYQIGYLAFFAPGGIGVRELLITTMLTPLLGPLAAGVAVAARIWNMIIELIAALVAYLIKLPNGKRI